MASSPDLWERKPPHDDAPERGQTDMRKQLPVPEAMQRRAERASVLCGKYSSTLRKVQFNTPHGTSPEGGTKAPFFRHAKYDKNKAYYDDKIYTGCNHNRGIALDKTMARNSHLQSPGNTRHNNNDFN